MARQLVIRTLLALFVGASGGLTQGVLAPRPASAADPAVYLIDGYIPRFAQKKVMNKAYDSVFDELQGTLLARQRRGQNMECSVQILTEASWLIQYTNLRARADKRLADLRQSFDFPPERQKAALEQSSEDGSWGGCFEEWFFRAWASADPAKELAWKKQQPAHPMKFLERIGTPQKIRDHMAALKISKASEGKDHRKELNLTVTGLGQLLFLKELAPVVGFAGQREAVATALKKYMDEEWQDPDTGYWGSWYEVDGKIVKTEDLSMTFHIASYRGGNVPMLNKLVRKTLRIRDRPYPFGWHDRGTQNNHHSYDVVRLLRFGWPNMTVEERAKAQAELFIVAARARRLSINSVGEFDLHPYSSIDEAYYFGVSLFDEIGYFRKSKRFWIDWEPEDGDELRKLILAAMDRLGVKSPMMDGARRKLMARD